MASDDELDQDLGSHPVPEFLSGNLLKPKLDSIFEEVQRNLPTIDFDVSDVSFVILYTLTKHSVFSKVLILPH